MESRRGAGRKTGPFFVAGDDVLGSSGSMMPIADSQHCCIIDQ
jgi:hypothetical protein